MVAARSVNGIEFGAIDDQPVHLIFMLVSPSNTSTEHTHILSVLSSIMAYEDVREKLFCAETAEQFIDVIKKSEEKYIE